MAYENKPLTGVLYKNDRKETDGHPDYKGSFYDQDLNERWFDAWINMSKAGKPYMSIKVGDIKEPRNAPVQQQAPALTADSEDIPF